MTYWQSQFDPDEVPRALYEARERSLGNRPVWYSLSHFEQDSWRAVAAEAARYLGAEGHE